MGFHFHRSALPPPTTARNGTLMRKSEKMKRWRVSPRAFLQALGFAECSELFKRKAAMSALHALASDAAVNIWLHPTRAVNKEFGSVDYI